MKKAFTLAEVLITLGIIGIIAVLTIPNVVAGYRKKVIETRLAKLYSALNQAIKLSEVKNGECKYWEWGSFDNHRDAELLEAWWEKYMQEFMPRVIYAKQENSSNDNVSGSGGYKVYFKDGSALAVEALPGDYARLVLYPDAKMRNKMYLFNEELEDRAGKDYFLFILRPENSCTLKPLVNANQTHEQLISQCLVDYNHTNGSAGGPCAELILQNGWHIPDDYPIKL